MTRLQSGLRFCRSAVHRIKYSKYWPRRVIARQRERRLALCRGYSTFVLDDFDHHFNKMAADSLRFHLSPQCAVDNEEHRERYEGLIARLEEPEPVPTPEEQAGIDTWKPFSDPVYNSTGKVVSYRLTNCPTQAKAAFDSWRSRQDEWAKQIQHARHDFVDVIPELWS
jgi:hypothetical protein